MVNCYVIARTSALNSFVRKLSVLCAMMVEVLVLCAMMVEVLVLCAMMVEVLVLCAMMVEVLVLCAMMVEVLSPRSHFLISSRKCIKLYIYMHCSLQFCVIISEYQQYRTLAHYIYLCLIICIIIYIHV